MATNAISGDVDVFSPTSLWSRPDSVDDDITFSQTKSSISTWKSDSIDEWLESVGLMKHSSLLRDQGITSGSVLLQLTEDHLKEMGLSLIGERIAFMNGVDKLRLEAGYYPTAKFFDGDYFLEVIEQAKGRRCCKMFPKRIILIRHAESQGNIDSKVYATTPDSLLKITEKGHIQAKRAGQDLKKMLGTESVSFYVSPFVRSRETFEEIKKQFDSKQVVRWREDPRIREQEWGNFQNPEEMQQVMSDRREIGSFFYRFPTGESGADVYDRVSIFLESMYRDMYKGRCGQNVLIVSHGLFCRLFLTRFYHWPIEFFHRLWNFKNCQYAVMEYQDDGYFKLITELIADPPSPSSNEH